MRIPFWPRRHPTELVVTFTQEIDLEALAAGKQGVFAGALTLAIVCPCGEKMSGNAPWCIAKPGSLNQPYGCEGCGNKVDVTYVTGVKQSQPAPVAVTISNMAIKDPDVEKISKAFRRALERRLDKDQSL